MDKHIILKSSLEPIDIFENFWDTPYSSILDSSNDSGRYSIIGSDPFLIIRSSAKQNIIKHKGKKPVLLYGSPFEILRQKITEAKKMFQNGYIIGYFGYDLCREIERLPDIAKNDLHVPDMFLCFYSSIIIYDHKANEFHIHSPDTNWSQNIGYLLTNKNKKSKVEKILKQIDPLNNKTSNNFICNQSRADYLDKVKKIISYINNGDVYQVNYSQRFQAKIYQDPWDIYKNLRSTCPTHYSGFINFGDFYLLSSSPELFLKIDNKNVVTKPIKGTRPRGKTKIEDSHLSQELLTSEKDIAENTMIVDVERNDLGRVCKIGTVKTRKLYELEKYANVMHLVSTVEGQLEKDTDVLDLLIATFPGGSITGAPKIRAMEIIEELEPTKRGPYTGSLGFIDFNDNACLNILIRSILIKNKTAYFQVGGGIVADSNPEKEFQETLDKGKAMFSALAQ